MTLPVEPLRVRHPSCTPRPMSPQEEADDVWTIQHKGFVMPDKGDAADAFRSELEQADGVILFDGHCAFCRNVVGRLLQVC